MVRASSLCVSSIDERSDIGTIQCIITVFAALTVTPPAYFIKSNNDSFGNNS